MSLKLFQSDGDLEKQDLLLFRFLRFSTLVGGEEGRKKAIEFWQKVDRGEIQ